MQLRSVVALQLALLLVGAVAIAGVGASETGTITASIATVMNVDFSDTLNLGSLSGDYDGTGGSTDGSGSYLELSVQSNVDYYVQVSCDGNMGRVGMSDDWRNEIETEYAIWKQITWNDYYAGPETYSGWVQDLAHTTAGGCAWLNEPAPAWFEAEIGGGKQGGNTAEDPNFEFNAIDYLPEHYDGATAASSGWPSWWNDNIYNYGADLTLRFFPALDLLDGYGTIAGNYDATITVVITSVSTQ